ncbi:hypothetical protein [Fodinicola feengrottensis]|uniref:Uncharacterized protein n=1 Tax=Fodinicola feengrottensis TaxID=435914 RepID=A0ABP4RWX5_9ACTN|nr:hypothetical protein [Fodinicola feengrottensis]
MTNPGFQAQQAAHQAQQAAQQQAQASMRAAQDANRLSQQGHRYVPNSHYHPTRRGGGFFSGLVTLVLLVVFLGIAVVVFRQVAPETFGELLGLLRQIR